MENFVLQSILLFQNPFDTYVLKPDAITGLYEKSPIIVPSTGEKRIVGCCCEADYDQIIWYHSTNFANKPIGTVAGAKPPIFSKGFLR